jgi:hypothetical protein
MPNLRKPLSGEGCSDFWYDLNPYNYINLEKLFHLNHYIRQKSIAYYLF